MLIEEVHKENLKLISLHNIEKGDVYLLKPSKVGTNYPLYTVVRHTHILYGWVFCQDRSTPQRVKDFLEVYEKE